MIKPTDNISNSNEYEQNQGNFIDQNEIRSNQYSETTNFRLDEYHKQPDSYNNYQIPPPKFQDIDQFVSNNISINKKDKPFNENLNLRPNEIINDPSQDEIKNYSKNTQFISKLPKYSTQMEENSMNDHQSYQHQFDVNDQQEYDHIHQVRYGEPNADQIYSYRQVQPEMQVEYRTQQYHPIQYETQPQQPYYNDSYADITLKNSTPPPSAQPQQNYYNPQYRRYNDVQHLQSPSPSHTSLAQSQYHIYQQDEYPPIETKQDHLGPYQSQRSPLYNQPLSTSSKYTHHLPPLPPLPPPPSSLQHQIYSQHPFTPPSPPPRPTYAQHPIYTQTPYQPRQTYSQSPPPQNFTYSSTPSQQYQDQELPTSSKLIYNHQSNIMLVDIPPSGKFAKPKLTKLQQRFNCQIMSTEIANFSPDASFQDESSNIISSRSNSGSISEYPRQPPIPQINQQPILPQPDIQIIPPKSSYTYQSNQYQQIQPQHQYSYYDYESQQIQPQQQDSYGYQQELSQPYNQDSRRPPSPSQFYQPSPYSTNYPSQDYSSKSSSSYYQQYQDHSPDSNSYSDYDQHKGNQEPQYVQSDDDDEDIIERIGNNEEYNESDDDTNTSSKSKSDKKIPGKRGRKKSTNPKPKKIKINNTSNDTIQNPVKIKKNKSKDVKESDKNEEQQETEKINEEPITTNDSTEKEEDKDALELLQTKKKNKFKPQRIKVKVRIPSENVEDDNQDQETVIEETQANFIKKGRGIFLRPIGFDEALDDETLVINPYTIGFQPQSYWETVNQNVTFGQLVNTYFSAKTDKIKTAKFIFKLYNMLLMTTHDERYKELVGFNWFSDFVISINRTAASAMLNLSTTNYDVALPALLDECGFDEVTPENFGLAHLSSYPGEEAKSLKLYYHKSSLFSKREMTTAELERLEVKKVSKRGRKQTKYPAHE